MSAPARRRLVRVLPVLVALAQCAPLCAAEPSPPRTVFVSMRSDEARLMRYRETCLQAVMAQLGERLPRDAQGRVLAGRVLLSLEVDAQGALRSLEVLQGAADARLTGAALVAVRSAAPFAAFPAELARDYERFVLTLPLDFGA